MRLNLGCGNDVKEGYVNVDLRKTHPTVLVADLSVLPWPFEDNSVEEILMLDFLEHFEYRMTNKILMECFRVLKTDGEVVVQVPDALHLTRALSQDGEYLCNACGGNMWKRLVCQKCSQHADSISNAAMMRLYGGQDYVGNFHQTCFTQRMLSLALGSCGFGSFVFEEPVHMWANWSIKTRATKADIW